MNEGSPMLKWFVSTRGMTSALIVVLAALIFGSYVAGVYINTPIPTYRADFGTARWITPPSAQAAGYFRKDIYLAQRAEHAWLLVAAPDSFSVYVNNHEVPNTNPAENYGGTATLVPACPTALADITADLHIGTNTIAIYVMTSHFNYPACVKVRGCIHLPMESVDFVSDDSWRASSYPGIQNNLIDWTDPVVDDVHWPYALYFNFPDEQLMQPLPVPPWLFQEPLTGHWISAFSGVPQTTTFSTDFDVPGDGNDAWLQLSSVGKHRVVINGHPMADSAEQSMAVDTQSDSDVHFYWVQPWIHSGKNHLAVRVDDPRAAPSLLAQLGYKDGKGNVFQVVSGGDWDVATSDGENHKAINIGGINYTGKTIGTPARMTSPSNYISAESTNRLIKEIFVTLLVALVLFMIHWAVADFMFHKGVPTAQQALELDAILHLPVILAVLVLQLLYYDVHFQPEWSQDLGWAWLILALWFALRLICVLQISRTRIDLPVRDGALTNWVFGRGFTICLAVITLVGFWIRASGINLFTLDQDEILIRYGAEGIWDRGYPSVLHNGLIVRMTTYEFLPYPVAISALFFGWSDWSVRVPSLLFGTFMIWNMGRAGREFFAPGAGLLVALVYALDPWNVYYARHCIHPQEAQFFIFLTFWSYYRSLREPGFIDKKEFYKACIFFVLGYLTWEGTGFVLPVLCILTLIMQAGRWAWLRQLHVYIGLFLVASVVIMQLALRATKAPAYLNIGYGLSELGPALVFADQTGAPGYYMDGIVRLQCHILPVVCFLLGFFFIGRHRALRYVMLTFILLLFAYSNFLPVYADRYFYFYQDFLLLGGCGAFYYMARSVYEIGLDHPVPFGTRVAWWTSAAAALLVVAVSSSLGFRLLGLQAGQGAEDRTTRYGLYWSESRPACEYIAAHWEPGDFVAGNLNYAYFYITGQYVDFTLNESLDQLSVFNVNNGDYGAYENIYVRVQSLVNEREMAQVFHHCKRLWYVAYMAPPSGPDKITSISSYVIKRSRIVYSGYSVNVYLADGMATRADEIVPDISLPPSLNSASAVAADRLKLLKLEKSEAHIQ